MPEKDVGGGACRDPAAGLLREGEESGGVVYAFDGVPVERVHGAKEVGQLGRVGRDTWADRECVRLRFHNHREVL